MKKGVSNVNNFIHESNIRLNSKWEILKFGNNSHIEFRSADPTLNEEKIIDNSLN
jgi:hypothetical protein